MKKNIKIVTFQRAHNFGAFLQVYALQSKLLKFGYKVEIVDYKNNNIDTQKPSHFYKKNNIKWTIKSLIEYINFKEKLNNKYRAFNYCINNYLKLTKQVKNIKELSCIIQKNDIIITGSDQVWNPKITKGVDDIYTLNLDNHVKKISYAPSIGSQACINSYEKFLISNISKIDKISVRETQAKEYLDKFINKRIEVVLDPTLLLTKKDWSQIILQNFNSINNGKYILVYNVALDENYIKIVNNITRESKLKIIHFDIKNIYCNEAICKYDASPFEFIDLIKNAEYVVTTSFHATVFSIIFNKKFWVVPHKTTGSRVTDLLNKLGISNRAVNTLEEFNKKNYDEEIDYDKVNKILEKEREKSIKWLTDAIEK